MESRIAFEMNFSFAPVGVLWSDDKPEGALEISQGKHCCIMFLFAQVARDRKTAVFGKGSHGCPGAGVGLGFGNCYLDAFDCEDSADVFASFFSRGADSFCDPLRYGAIADRMPADVRPKFLKGEYFHESPEKARKWIMEELPHREIPVRYVVYKPLEEVTGGDDLKAVVFLADALQIAGLATLAGAVTEGIDPISVPQGAACQQMGLYVYPELDSTNPRAVLGLTDLAARVHLRKSLGEDLLAFSVPVNLFRKMEAFSGEGLFDAPIWTALRG